MKLGRLLPSVLVALCLTDIGLRFMPLDPLCFQAWECMARFQEPGAIFQKDTQFKSPTTHGNLSNMGNLPEQRQYRPQVFTTDRTDFGIPGIRRARCSESSLWATPSRWATACPMRKRCPLNSRMWLVSTSTTLVGHTHT